MLTQTAEQLNLGRWRMAVKVRNVIDRLLSGDFNDPGQIAEMRAYVTVCVGLEDASLSFHKDRPDRLSVTLSIWGDDSVPSALANKLEAELLTPLLEGKVAEARPSVVEYRVRSWHPELLLIETSDIVAFLRLSSSLNLTHLQARGILYRLSGSMAAVDAVLEEFDSSGLHRWSNRKKLLELIETVDQWGA